jgi:superfamily II DNA or RNA helicase
MPRIDMLIDTAAMKSKNDARQKFGRGVRLCEGKSGLIYFDIRDDGNRFEAAAKSRARALKDQQISVTKVSWEDDKDHVKWIFDEAEKALKKVMEKENQGELFS